MPADGHLLAMFEFLKSGGTQHLHQLPRTGGRARRVAVGADVDAAAVGRWLVREGRSGVPAIDGGRAELEMEVVVCSMVAACVAEHVVRPVGIHEERLGS